MYKLNEKFTNNISFPEVCLYCIEGFSTRYADQSSQKLEKSGLTIYSSLKVLLQKLI